MEVYCMCEENTSQKERFLQEVEQKLLRKELDARLLEDGLIRVKWNGQPLCSVDGNGTVRFRPADITEPNVDQAVFQQSCVQFLAQDCPFYLLQKSFLLWCKFFVHIIPPILAPFLSAKRRWSLVRENQQSSAHNFVKDFSPIFLKSSRRSPLKKGAATENPLEYGKTEVQILFEPLQAAISSMELPKNFENKKLPNPLR